MKIIIDNREKKLIPLIQALNIDLKLSFDIEISKLDLGDFIIQDTEGNNILIIERKSLSDLATSIRDGRYAEQSYRYCIKRGRENRTERNNFHSGLLI